MTVSTLATRVFYAGDGVSLTFAVPFPFLSRTHLRATRFRVGVAPETLTIVSATGEGNPAGGSVTLSGPVGSAWSLLIERDTPETQETDYTPNDAFPAETHERGLDKLTMLIQELRTEMDRAVRFPPEDQRDGELPSSATRANGYLGFGPDGSPIIVPSVPVGGGSGRFSLGTRKTVSATAATYNVTAADGNWITVNIAPGVGMPTGGTINLPGAAAGLPVGYTVMIQLYSSTGFYPSSGQIEVNAAGFREWYFSFAPNLSPMLAAEFVWDGTAWAPLSPYNDRLDGFLPLSAGSTKALTGELWFADQAIIAAGKDDAGDHIILRTGYGQDAVRVDSNGKVWMRNNLEVDGDTVTFDFGDTDASSGGGAAVFGVRTLTSRRRAGDPLIGNEINLGDRDTFGDGFFIINRRTSRNFFNWNPSGGPSGGDELELWAGDITLTCAGQVNVTGGLRVGQVGFQGSAHISKPTVTGSRGGNAALASLLTALANYGLITNSTTA